MQNKSQCGSAGRRAGRQKRVYGSIATARDNTRHVRNAVNSQSHNLRQHAGRKRQPGEEWNARTSHATTSLNLLPPSGVSGTMWFSSCPSLSAKGPTPGTPSGTLVGASIMGPPLLTSAAFCKRTEHLGHGTKNTEDERSTATNARASPTSWSNDAEYNAAQCKPSHSVKGHLGRRLWQPGALQAIVQPT